MAKHNSGQSDGEGANRGEDFDPTATPDAFAEEVPPQAVSHGSPVSEDEFSRLKQVVEEAESDSVKRAIVPQTDDSARIDESETEPKHD